MDQYYIILPHAPWGGRTGVLGPFELEQAQQWLDDHAHLMMPDCPPKLCKLVKDYAG